MSQPLHASNLSIHPTAIVSPNAEIEEGVEIGPYCTVGDHVKIQKNVQLISHVCIDGYTEIGEETVIFPFASIGLIPQDLKYRGEKSKLIIGKRNKIREYVTMQPGTENGGMLTSIGDDGLFMASAHVAHDCHVGNRVIMANNATLAGHVNVEDGAIIGGLAAIHQFVRVGKYAMIGGMCAIKNDVIPYGIVSVEESSLVGLNLVGLKRQGIPRSEIDSMRKAYEALFKEEGIFSERLEGISQKYKDSPQIMEIISFIKASSSRALCVPKK